jgi:hypothetical protein
MAGLIDQLQEDALDPSIPVSTLLRKVKVAAAKLALDDALAWVAGELNGYRAMADIPAYRKGAGTTFAWNPYHGWQPIQFGSHTTADLVARVLFHEPIGNYESLLETGVGPYFVDIPNEMLSALNETLSYAVPRIANQVGRGLIVRIVQHVRDLVLDWALELSQAGVTGDGLRFSSAEKEAASVAQITIGEFHGSFNTGNASGSGSTISQSTSTHQSAEREKLFDEIAEAIKHVASETDRQGLLAANAAMRAANERPAFIEAYQRFSNVAADHMTILAPFLPALAGLLS